MKKIIVTFILLITVGFCFAQSPQSFNYQAVCRDNIGNIIANQTVNLRITIYDITPSGTVLYKENHLTSTNSFGLINVSVGTGSWLAGNFLNIPWGAGAKYLGIEINTGSGYNTVGTPQLLSVPYALYANQANVAGVPGPTGTQGPTGNNGIQGVTGPTGIAGVTGVTGLQGVTGADGAFNAWSLTGNTGTNSNSNFIGTIDSADLCFKVKNENAGRIDIGPKRNTAFGYQTLNKNTTGYFNCAFGNHALFNNKTGVANIAIGNAALYNDSAGQQNIAIGHTALYNNTIGILNTAVGGVTLHNNTAGQVNTAIGYNALGHNTTGNDNTATGSSALYLNTTGFLNVANGYWALYNDTTGSYNTAIGVYADISTAALSNTTTLGYNAKANANNKVRIGNTAVTVIEGQVAWSFPSDGRFKSNVKENVSGLEFITKLHPVSYNFDTKKFDEFLMKNMSDSIRHARMKDMDYSASSKIVHSGFIAQEVEKAARETGFIFDGVNIPENEDGNYSIAYSQFVVPLVKAVQELNTKNEEQLKIIDGLQRQIDELKKLIKK